MSKFQEYQLYQLINMLEIDTTDFLLKVVELLHPI